MDAHAGGFVDDEQVVVFVEDIERNRFGFGAKRRALAGFDHDVFAAAKFLRGLCCGSVHLHKPCFDKLLQSSTGKLWALGREPAVETGAAIGIGDEQFLAVGLRTHSEI